MTITNSYCDRCGCKWNTFSDSVTVKNHERGTLTLDLCWACSAYLITHFESMKTEGQQKAKAASLTSARSGTE